MTQDIDPETGPAASPENPVPQDDCAVLRARLEELERSKEKIRQAHHQWMTALDAIDDPVFMHDKDFRVMRSNRAYAERAGMPVEEVIGKPYYEVFPVHEGPLPHCCVATQEAGTSEDEIRLDSGETFVSRASSITDSEGRYLYSLHIMEDVTGRKRMEHALLESEEKFRSMSEATQDALIMIDHEGNITFWNPAAEKMFGYSSQEVLGKELHALVTPSRLYESASKGFERFHDTGEGAIIGTTRELMALRKGGGEFPVELSVSALKFRDKWHAVGVVRDITERKHAEEALLRSVNSLNEAQRLAHLGDWDLDLAGNVLTWSDEIYRIFEIDPHEFGASYDAFLNAIHPDDRELVNRAYTDSVKSRTPYNIVHRLLMKNGEVKYVNERCETFYDAEGKPLRSIGTVHDITESKRAEMSLQRLNRALKTLSSCNRELVHGGEETQLLQSMCRVIVEIGGYRMAWAGYVQQDAEKSIRSMAQAGFEEGYLDTVGFTWADNALGQRPAGRAVRSGSTQISQDMQLDPGLSPWHAEAVKRGYASTIALPLADGGKVFGVLVIYAAEPNAFNQEEVALLKEMADDLAYGIGTLRLRQEQQRNAEKLRKGLEDTVLAISAMVEMRDPYTAGHEQRVAELAAAIATEMGLPADRVYGIHLAGSIHDLGKIQVPAEILSKPGRLNEVEYRLVKQHPQIGYEILKNIEFPCPVAQMVLQHHERLDGSGYPQGLKGGEILPEARILSVADVVEAMASHRPYRPGIGLPAALEEIGRNRGVLYDPDAVDACLRLFREKNYEFNGVMVGQGLSMDYTGMPGGRSTIGKAEK